MFTSNVNLQERSAAMERALAASAEELAAAEGALDAAAAEALAGCGDEISRSRSVEISSLTCMMRLISHLIRVG